MTADPTADLKVEHVVTIDFDTDYMTTPNLKAKNVDYILALASIAQASQTVNQTGHLNRHRKIEE